MQYKNLIAVIFAESAGFDPEDFVRLIEGWNDLFQDRIPMGKHLSDEHALALLDIWYRRKPQILKNHLKVDPDCLEPYERN
ncbi:MAG: hypothetical protein ACOWWM_19420 [Desulfobacterales bacterium]